MFRKPRHTLSPSLGRPPSPVNGESPVEANASVTYPPTPSSNSPRIKTAMQSPGKLATPPVMLSSKPRTVAAAGKNGSILNFFQKSSAKKGTTALDPLFLDAKSSQGFPLDGEDVPPADLEDEDHELYSIHHYANGDSACDEPLRFNEENISNKRRKLSPTPAEQIDVEAQHRQDAQGAGHKACSPPPPDIDEDPINIETSGGDSAVQPPAKRAGPFLDDSDSDNDCDDPSFAPVTPGSHKMTPLNPDTQTAGLAENESDDVTCDEAKISVPSLQQESTSMQDDADFADFEGMDDFEDEYPEGEEFLERRWQMEQRRLELEEQGFDSEVDEEDLQDFDINGEPEIQEANEALQQVEDKSSASTCPVCSASFAGVSDQEASVHVNHCLDGNPTPLPSSKSTPQPKADQIQERKSSLSNPARPARSAKPGQANPFTLGVSNGSSSAFSRLMSGHAEDAAWATAAASEYASRGKPAYQRTCPFYKILPGFNICVDAFRYGAVQGCNAYFLSHFHSDHYVGLTATWNHGPIYCSRPTANLVRQQLRVDPSHVIDLEFEKKVEVPRTNGVYVTMIPANHCPGSSLYLFEKTIGSGRNQRVQRVLHCGDFRACPAHVEHPLLKPDIVDSLTGKTQHQKIDVCYLDTTYLNPRYAFPSQEDVIQACADMCVSLSREKVDPNDDWEQMKRERAGNSMAKFVRKEPHNEELSETAQDVENLQVDAPTDHKIDKRGRLLVIVGTYSIGKERICLGIARALGSKIYAPPGKQRICACLEDPELNRLLTRDPRAAQVHMTPLFEIRAETLTEYLADYRDTFSRAVAFRPSGWNYRPPGSRFVESPAVSTVLFSENWKSSYSVRDLVPQRGSNSRAATYGVPYSEHSSFRELTMFCCALRIDKIIPTVNVGSAKSRERMKLWVERWNTFKKKDGLFRPAHGQNIPADTQTNDKPRAGWYPGNGTWELRTTL